MAMAGEHPFPGNVCLQRLPHPPPLGPHSCTLLTKVSPWGNLGPGSLLSGPEWEEGGRGESRDLGVDDIILGSPVLRTLSL